MLIMLREKNGTPFIYRRIGIEWQFFLATERSWVDWIDPRVKPSISAKHALIIRPEYMKAYLSCT